ncbi:hypothetical protein [Olleya aquimaris]|uniref:Lipoprotein n=1 Tax=Olleya aquimaris TaxID=639310 RepID=A0A327R9K7_9FLAO|nr:hypothetical protein [Olleya aquimaris]RAJ12163.1 hypothetical protein LY08_02416 [Olleya aquimaris]
MKTIFKLILVTVGLIFIQSCWPEAREINRQYQIKNNSTVELQIRFFNTFDDTFFDINILENEIYNGDVLTYTTGNDQWFEDNGSFPRRAYFDCDSLKIIFSNSKFITYDYTSGLWDSSAFSLPLNRHPLRHGNYSEVQKEVFQFIITEYDFNNATPCDGDCLE